MNREQLTLGSLFDGIGGFPYYYSVHFEISLCEAAVFGCNYY